MTTVDDSVAIVNQVVIGKGDVIVPPAELEEFWLEHPEIVKTGDPILRMKAQAIGKISAETRQLIDFMAVIMKKAAGIGLAAPQVGHSVRLFTYDTGEGLVVMINPVIVSMKGSQVEPDEGCLSIPGLRGTVDRALEIRVRAFDRNGKPFSVKAKDLEARVIQHELDHLNGILFIDHADPATLRWESADDMADSDE